MPGPTRPLISARNLLMTGRAIRKRGNSLEVRMCGVNSGTGVWLQFDSPRSAETMERRIFAYLNTSRSDDDYNTRVLSLATAAEMELAETKAAESDKHVAIGETRQDQLARKDFVEKTVAEVKEDWKEKGIVDPEETTSE